VLPVGRLAATPGPTDKANGNGRFRLWGSPVIETKFPALRKTIPRSLDQGIVAEVAVVSPLLPLKSGA
jgi:hypothetical protein